MQADLSTADVAARLGVSTRAIIKWLGQGLFPNAYKMNPHSRNSPYRIPEKDVLEFEESRRQRSAK